MAHKEMVYLKGYAKGRGFFKMLKAIHVCTVLHEGQTRKAGGDYIEHPMRVTSSLVALGIHDEITLGGSLAHDVVEDCNVTLNQLIHDYGMDAEIVNLASKLDKKDMSTKQYYDILRSDIRLILIKLSDRCHNVSSMAGAFSMKKMKEYIEETEQYVLPLAHDGKNLYPEYSDALFTLKYHVESIVKTVKHMIQMVEDAQPQPTVEQQA